MTEFDVEVNDTTVPILDAEFDAEAMDENAEDEALREYLVGVDWIDARAASEAYWGTGMYANQNTVTKLRNQFTLEHLYNHFDIDE